MKSIARDELEEIEGVRLANQTQMIPGSDARPRLMHRNQVGPLGPVLDAYLEETAGHVRSVLVIDEPKFLLLGIFVTSSWCLVVAELNALLVDHSWWVVNALSPRVRG